MQRTSRQCTSEVVSNKAYICCSLKAANQMHVLFVGFCGLASKKPIELSTSTWPWISSRRSRPWLHSWKRRRKLKRALMRRLLPAISTSFRTSTRRCRPFKLPWPFRMLSTARCFLPTACSRHRNMIIEAITTDASAAACQFES